MNVAPPSRRLSLRASRLHRRGADALAIIAQPRNTNVEFLMFAPVIPSEFELSEAKRERVEGPCVLPIAASFPF
jgi:hypothetical protein